METIWFLGLFVLLAPYDYVETSTCRIMDMIDSCRYTVLCDTYAGSASNYNCQDEPAITFQITNSRIDVLSKGFFGATNFDSRVRVIKAINNNWKTVSASALSYYNKVIKIDLSGNQIEEIQNEAFKALFTLRYLNLSSNSIETIYTRALLIGETTLGDIEVLDLSNNKLKNIASDAFYKCPNIRDLYLQNNDIANFDDSVFSNSKNLTRLYLQNNNLLTLNMTLIYLQNLKDLDLSYNRLEKLSGFETNRLTSLERVNMSNNMIHTIETNCFNQAFNLESLDLRNNKLTSPITNLMFINNGLLTYLNLYNNNISKIQDNAFQHNKLTYLNLENNFISGEITETTFSGLKNITSLSLHKQNITAINANAFQEMSSLLNLNLSDNNITAIDPLAFKNTNTIDVLDLSYNNIKKLNFLKDVLTNVTEIYLNNNNIELIPAHTFLNQTQVKKLDISNNKIIMMEQYSLPLNNLQFLNVSKNPLTGSLKSNVLSPGRYLRYLDLSNFNITRIEDMAFIDLPVLTRLNLSFNAIEYIGQKNFINLTNLFSLDLSNNRLTDIQINGTYLKSLEALYLNNNNLVNINGAIPNATKIMYLDISYNNISELTGVALEFLKELRVLRADHNTIKTFHNPQLNILSKLQDLHLSSNQISTIDFTFHKDLVAVDISNNSVNSINNTMLQDLHSLQVLNISKNKISLIPPGVFQNTSVLKTLNISSNNLEKLRYGSLRGLHNTTEIDLSKNNITDIDVDIFHECNELTRLIIDYNHIESLDVEHLIQVAPKLTHLSIGGNPIKCKEIVQSIRNIDKKDERFVEVTSIHKIFHEDNVHGIRCGNVDLMTSTSVIPFTTLMTPAETSNSSTLIIWCTILSICVIVIPVAYWIRKRIVSYGTHSQSGMLYRHSVELNGSDLLN